MLLCSVGICAYVVAHDSLHRCWGIVGIQAQVCMAHVISGMAGHM